ncbi:MAG TPA: M15 family metallopeptidase [Streptosporangiaceae bacterium]
MRGTNARPAPPEKPLLLSDPRVPAVQVRDCGEPLTALGESFGPCRALVRVSVARRLAQARDALPPGVRLRVVDCSGRELDLGTPVDTTPEQSEGACYFGAPGVARRARANRELLARVLRGAGLVNYPTEWWHWSYGDRYWALVTGAQAALYGPVAADRVAR